MVLHEHTEIAAIDFDSYSNLDLPSSQDQLEQDLGRLGNKAKRRKLCPRAGQDRFRRLGAQPGFQIGAPEGRTRFAFRDTKNTLHIFETHEVALLPRENRFERRDEAKNAGMLLGSGLDCAFKCLSARNATAYAVKVYNLLEASALSSVYCELFAFQSAATKHLNVVNYNWIIETRDHLFVIMELLENGEDLLEVLVKRKIPLSEALTRKLLKQILEGLQHLHSHEVYHNDIRPENVLVDLNAESAKLIDFGLASFPALLKAEKQRAEAELQHLQRRRTELLEELEQLLRELSMAHETLRDAQALKAGRGQLLWTLVKIHFQLDQKKAELLRAEKLIAMLTEALEVLVTKPRGVDSYSPPEIWRANALPSVAGDLWGVGWLLHVMLLAAPPFSSMEQAKRHSDYFKCMKERESFKCSHSHRMLPANVRRLLEDLFAANPQHRPATVDEVLRADWMSPKEAS